MQGKGEVEVRQKSGDTQQTYMMRLSLEDDTRSMEREVVMEPTGTGAAGELAGRPPRQEQ